jgi:hypothetical protein
MLIAGRRGTGLAKSQDKMEELNRAQSSINFPPVCHSSTPNLSHSPRLQRVGAEDHQVCSKGPQQYKGLSHKNYIYKNGLSCRPK